MRSDATTVEEYLDELPEERRKVVAAVRELVLQNLPDGYQETINWGMISYEIPLERYPDTYNGQPLSYLAIAAQKNYYALYMMGLYTHAKQEAQLKEGYSRAGKNLSLGKSCLRFKKLEELEPTAVAEVIKGTSVDDFIRNYEEARRR